MDWTYSPYIALHFATSNIEMFNTDGIIWMVDYHKAHEQLPQHLKSLLKSEGANAFTIELLSSAGRIDRGTGYQNDAFSFREVIQSLEHFDELGGEDAFLLFFEPASTDDRIVNQFSLFSVMPTPLRALDIWLSRHPDLYRRVIIPANLKWKIRDKLDQSNVTERVLFPGLDGLCQWLKRQYSPKALPNKKQIRGESQTLDKVFAEKETRL